VGGGGVGVGDGSGSGLGTGSGSGVGAGFGTGAGLGAGLGTGDGLDVLAEGVTVRVVFVLEVVRQPVLAAGAALLAALFAAGEVSAAGGLD
jgi:hypothetical protein